MAPISQIVRIIKIKRITNNAICTVLFVCFLTVCSKIFLVATNEIKSLTNEVHCRNLFVCLLEMIIGNNSPRDKLLIGRLFFSTINI